MSPLPPEGVVESERRCVGCGYALRGLPVTGRCPECAAPISTFRDLDAPLSSMPPAVVRRFRRAAWPSAAVMVLIAAVLLTRTVGSWPEELAAFVGLLLSTLWVAAVWLMTPAVDLPQASWHGFADRNRLRVAARWLAVPWVLYGAAWTTIVSWPAMPAPFESVLRGVMSLSGSVGLVGFVVFGLVLGHLAAWVRDSTAGGIFSWVIWSVPVSVILGLTGHRVVVFAAVAIWLASMVAFAVAGLSMARSIHYAVIHARDEEDRDERREERRRRDDERLARNLARLDQQRKKGTRYFS